VAGSRADALARLDVFIGEWAMEARFPGDQPTPSGAAGESPRAHSRFERGGTVCTAGSLSGWAIPDFEPIAMIPPGTRLTAFHSDHIKGSAGTAVLQCVVDEVEAGVYRPKTG